MHYLDNKAFDVAWSWVKTSDGLRSKFISPDSANFLQISQQIYLLASAEAFRLSGLVCIQTVNHCSNNWALDAVAYWRGALPSLALVREIRERRSSRATEQPNFCTYVAARCTVHYCTVQRVAELAWGSIFKNRKALLAVPTSSPLWDSAG